MIKLKKNVDFSVLANYGFERELRGTYKWGYTVWHFWIKPSEDYKNGFQVIDIYETPFIDAWGKTVYKIREVVLRPHANNCAKILDIVIELIEKGILEYVKSEVKA